MPMWRSVAMALMVAAALTAAPLSAAEDITSDDWDDLFDSKGNPVRPRPSPRPSRKPRPSPKARARKERRDAAKKRHAAQQEKKRADDEGAAAEGKGGRKDRKGAGGRSKGKKKGPRPRPRPRQKARKKPRPRQRQRQRQRSRPRPRPRPRQKPTKEDLGSPVVGIDFGSEFIKIAVDGLSKPTDPDPIVLNDSGQRKTPHVLALRGDTTIAVGSEAAAMLLIRPDASFAHLKQMLGRLSNESALGRPTGGPHWFRQVGVGNYRFGGDVARGTLTLPDGEGGSHTPEELVGLMLTACREMAAKEIQLSAPTLRGPAAEGRNVVLTVPVWWDRAQRKALKTAAQLAGMNVLLLLNEHTAVAFKHAISRPPGDIAAKLRAGHRRVGGGVIDTVALIYDVGAVGATACLTTISVATKTVGRKVKISETVSVGAVAWTAHVGGRSFDSRLAQLFATRYAKQEGGADVRNDPRAMNVLLKEANRAKEKLSANNVISVIVDGLARGKSELRTNVTRATFEKLCKDLIREVLSPVRRVLDEAGLKRSAVKKVILVGGGTRMPIIRIIISKMMRQNHLDSLNGDESIALGAAAYGASIFRGSSFERDLKLENERFPDGVFETQGRSVPEMSSDAIDASRSRMKMLRGRAAEVSNKAAARYELESVGFSIKDSKVGVEVKSWLKEHAKASALELRAKLDEVKAAAGLSSATAEVEQEEDVALSVQGVMEDGLKLPRQLIPGDTLELVGVLPSKSKGAMGLFDVLLVDDKGWTSGDIAVKVIAKEKHVVRVARVAGEWVGQETAAPDSGPASPFAPGATIKLRIKVAADSFTISTSKPKWSVEYPRKMALEQISKLKSRRIVLSQAILVPKQLEKKPSVRQEGSAGAELDALIDDAEVAEPEAAVAAGASDSGGWFGFGGSADEAPAANAVAKTEPKAPSTVESMQADIRLLRRQLLEAGIEPVVAKEI